MYELALIGLGAALALAAIAIILRLTSKAPPTPPRRPRSYVISRD